MGVSKVEFGGDTLIDLTEDSVTPETMMKGTTAHNSAGEPIEGTFDPDIYQTKTDDSLDTTDKTIVGAINELNDKINATGGGSGGADESMVGTWVFNDMLGMEAGEGTFELEFTSDGINYNQIDIGDLGPPVKVMRYNYLDSDGAFGNQLVYSFSETSQYGVPPLWQDEVYKTIEILSEPQDPILKALIRANAKKQGGSSSGSSLQMPQIRFANFQDAQGTMHLWEGNPFTFTVEIVGGGELKVGDLLQICVRRKYWNKVKDTEEDFRHKWKLRKVLQREITAEDIGKRFLSINVTIADVTSKGKWMFRNDRKTSNVDTHSYMYFRIKRVTKWSDTTGEECDAIFSNVEKVAKTYEYSENRLAIK